MMGEGRKVTFMTNTRIRVDDGEVVTMPANTHLTMPPMKEIIETGIESILFSGITASHMPRSHHPLDGEAKWFVDELGQNWVKFREQHPSTEMIRTLVLPAFRVLMVEYPAVSLTVSMSREEREQRNAANDWSGS